jgi:hypothetical protein
VALFALLLSATVHAQDFLSSELSSERTIALIESKDFDSKESTSDSESQTQEHQNWLFHMQGTETQIFSEGTKLSAVCAMQGSNLRLVAAATARNAKKHETARTCNFSFLISNSTSQRAISSVVEHLLHTQGVAGSIPASRISSDRALALERLASYLELCPNTK